MNETPIMHKHLLFVAACLLLALPKITLADMIYVTNGTAISEFNASTGATVNAALVTLSSPAVAVSLDGSGHLYVLNNNSGTVGEYNASTGAPINAALVTGLLAAPLAMAVDGSGHLYVLNEGGANSISEFNARTGAVINAALVTGIYAPTQMTLDRSGHLFVKSQNGTVGVYNAGTGATINANLLSNGDVNGMVSDGSGHLYTTGGINGGLIGIIGEYNANTGAVINADLVTGLVNTPLALALDGSGDLYASISGSDAIGEFNASTGATINVALVTGLNSPVGMTIVAVPEPSSFTLLGLTAAVGFCVWRLTRRRACGKVLLLAVELVKLR
jgi:streptogramin lyase